MKRTYTWLAVDRHNWVTEEQRYGTPDYHIVRVRNDYFVEGRTSSQWAGPFDGLSAAKDYAG